MCFCTRIRLKSTLVYTELFIEQPVCDALKMQRKQETAPTSYRPLRNMEGSHSYIQIIMYCDKYVKISEKELQEHNIVTETSIMLHTPGLFKSVSVCEGNFIQKVKKDTTMGKKK